MMSGKRLARVGVVGVLVLVALGAALLLLRRLAEQRHEQLLADYQTRAIALIREKAADAQWLAQQQKEAADGRWLGENFIRLQDGNWLVYVGRCSKDDPARRGPWWRRPGPYDIFIAVTDKGKWYYSSYHFCVGMLALATDGQPLDLANMTVSYYLREFDGRPESCRALTWPRRDQFRVGAGTTQLIVTAKGGRWQEAVVQAFGKVTYLDDTMLRQLDGASSQSKVSLAADTASFYLQRQASVGGRSHQEEVVVTVRETGTVRITVPGQ